MSIGLLTNTRGRLVPLQNTVKRSKEVSLSISAGANYTLTTVHRAVAVFYADSNNVWRMKFNVEVTGSMASSGNWRIALNGIVFKNTGSGVGQHVDAWVYDASKPIPLAVAEDNTNKILWFYNGTTSTSGVVNVFYGDVELNAEPTWSSLGTTWAAIAEVVGDVTAYIPPCAASVSGIINNDPTNTVGNPIKGKTDGSAIPAGYVGEIVLDVANSGLTATYGGGAQIVATGSLTAGVYLLTCNVSVSNAVRPTSGIGSPGLFLKVNGNTIDSQPYSVYWYSAISENESPQGFISLLGTVVVPQGATHTVNVELYAQAASGTPTNYTCASRGQGRLKAIRIG